MKKNIALLLGLSLGLTAVGCALPAAETRAESSKELIVSETPTSSEEMDTTGAEAVTMYRLYNPNSGEHFYTGNETEKTDLVKAGWSDEGIGWIAPVTSDTPVYRLYNANAGDHHYTMNAKERNELVSAGWKDEGTGWYSDDDKTVPLYREYNPNAVTGTHNYTTDKAEHDGLVKAGWKDEGVGWYAIGDGKNDPPKKSDDDTLKIGDTVILGTYEQDNDLTNGPEPIEWQYIGNRDGHKFLLSKYALDFGYYNDGPLGGRDWEDVSDVTWEDCELRAWLNEDFYDTAFSDSDKEVVLTAHNENPDSYELYKPWMGGAKGGNATDDRVFLLSWTEARDYLDGEITQRADLSFSPHNPKLSCIPTVYADEQGVYADFHEDIRAGGARCDWWLRSPGVSQNEATYVTLDGGLASNPVCFDGTGVRPAILID